MFIINPYRFSKKASSEAFLPSDLSNLWQWYNPSSVTSSTNPFWPDQSGNDNELVSVIGSVGTGSLSTYSTVIIDTTAAMQIRTQLVFDKPNQTIFLVVKPTFNVVFADYGNVSNKLIIFNVDGGTGTTMRFLIRDVEGDVVQRTDIAIPDGKTAFNIYGLVVDGDNQKIYVYDHTGSSYTANNASYDPATTWEGRSGGQAYQSWGSIGTTTFNESQGNAELAEIIIYQETKSLSEVNQLGNYLADKYSLAWTNF